MDRDELTRRLFATFLEELKEQVRAFNRELLELEKQTSEAARTESVRTLFRIAHTLKGASRSTGLASLEATCHRLEELLGTIRDGSRALSPPLFQLFFACADGFDRAGIRLSEDRTAPLAGLLRPLLDRLEEALRQGAERETPVLTRIEASAPTPIEPASAPPDPPVEVSSVVRVSGQRLDALLAQSGELRVARRRLDARRDQIGSIVDFVARWRGDFLGASKMVARGLHRPTPANGSGVQATNGSDSKPEREARAPGVPRRAERALEQTADFFERLERSLDQLAAAFAEDRQAVERAAGPLEVQIHRARMQPFAEACEGLTRTVRDLAVTQGKDVTVDIVGGSTELDRSLIDGVRGPLLHLVRNAVDHGIETPEERRENGKPLPAKVTVAATVRGELVEISVADDGRGIAWDSVRRQAAKRNIVVADDDRDLVRLLFSPGFSTAPMITEVSGRGVGLDVVKTQIESMRGTVEVAKANGSGTRFTLTLPLTLTTLRALFVRAGGEVYALPCASVRRLLRVDRRALPVVEGRQSVATEGLPIPIVPLAGVLGLTVPATAPIEKLPLVILGSGNDMVAFAVDELLAEQDVVVKPLGPRLRALRHILGAALLPSGRVTLFLNPAPLLETAEKSPALSRAPETPASAERQKKRLILADDSVTTRTLEKSILEAAGYEVATAPDGSAAWQLLQETGADAVVSDVEMPKMDGFALARAIRGSKRFRDLPIILLTALETPQDRTRGMEAGADAYLVKSAFDQKTLLATIGQLL